MKIQIASRQQFPSNLNLPLAAPLESWDVPILVKIARGISRNVVRFVCYRDAVYAVKEINQQLAVREYGLLRQLEDLGLPVVQAVALVSERGRVPARPSRPRCATARCS